MLFVNKFRLSVCAGTAAALLLASVPHPAVEGSLFFPSFILSACSEPQKSDGDTEYHFMIFDLIRKIFV